MLTGIGLLMPLGRFWPNPQFLAACASLSCEQELNLRLAVAARSRIRPSTDAELESRYCVWDVERKNKDLNCAELELADVSGCGRCFANGSSWANGS